MDINWISSGKIYQDIERKVETILKKFGFSFACEKVFSDYSKFYLKENFTFKLFSNTPVVDSQLAEWVYLYSLVLSELKIQEDLIFSFNQEYKNFIELIKDFDLNSKIQSSPFDFDYSNSLILSFDSKIIKGSVFYDEECKVLCLSLDFKNYWLNSDSNEDSSRTLILYEINHHKLATKLANYYREDGMPIIMQPFTHTLSKKGWINFAKDNDIGGILLIDNLVKITVINLNNLSENEVEISRFSF